MPDHRHRTSSPYRDSTQRRIFDFSRLEETTDTALVPRVNSDVRNNNTNNKTNTIDNEHRSLELHERNSEAVKIVQNAYSSDEEFIPPQAQAIWTPSSTQDVTIHYEMDIVDDVGSRLEEFARLKRLGQFTTAESFFQGSLEEFHGLFPVALEYADMLAEQGMYGRTRRLRYPMGEEVSSVKDLDPREDPSIFVYRANWELIQAFSAIYSQGCMREAYEKVRSLETPMRMLRRLRRKQHLPLDSAEVQVFRYALKILSQVEREANLIPEHHFDFWSNWTELYQLLLAEGRVWDARDIMIASIQADGAANTWKWVFGIDISSPQSFSRLLEDWELGQYDEATFLALLDILVSVCQELASDSISAPSNDDLILAQRCLRHASSLVDVLQENHAELAKTRSYLRLIIARANIERKLVPQSMDPGIGNHLASFPGLTVWMGVVPVYLPIKTENPGWISVASTTASSHHELESAASTMHALGDYPTEILCRSELLHRCSQPRAIQQLTHIADLQTCTQGDHLGYQHTCLARFLCTHTPPQRQALLETLRASHRTWSSFPSLTAWCIDTVERALVLLTVAEDRGRALPPPHMLGQDRTADFAASLPQYIQDQLCDGLDRMYHLDLDQARSARSTTTSTTALKSALKHTPTRQTPTHQHHHPGPDSSDPWRGEEVDAISLDGSFSTQSSSSSSSDSTDDASFDTAHSSKSKWEPDHIQTSPRSRSVISVTVEDDPETSETEVHTIPAGQIDLE